MQFTELGDEVVSEWLPTVNHQGFYNILHGGVQATLIDEIAAWAVMVKLRTSGVTTKMEIKYLKPVYTNKDKVVLKASIINGERRNASIAVGLYNSDGELCSSAIVEYFIYPEGVAGKRLFYPGYEAFFEDANINPEEKL